MSRLADYKSPAVTNFLSFQLPTHTLVNHRRSLPRLSFLNMKFALFLITLSALLSSVCAFDARGLHTNAERLARGLSPLPPVRRATPVIAAKRTRTSPKPDDNGGIDNSCNTGTVHCCNSVTYANAGFARVLSGLLGIVVPANTAIGLTCHPLSGLGIGGNHCSQQPVCCKNNKMRGLVVIGCSPINING